jgi:hypothetical protein
VTGYHSGPGGGATLVDILDRVLDKGLVVAGDIKVSLANVELLTIRIRLLVCSIDKAEQIGLNWWRYDQSLVRTEPAEPPPGTDLIVARLEARIAQLETQLALQHAEATVERERSRSATKSTRARGREPREPRGRS